MCGIFGFVGDVDFAHSLDLTAAVAALRHRGPDGSGTRVELSADGRVACALAHTRLAVIDTSDDSRQPMSTPEGRFTLVYNGEVYRFRALRQELESLGETFRSRGDTEVVLKAAARWGDAAAERLDGMFALGVWDREEGCLRLIRDRLGIKPLYYRVWDKGIAFASEVRALLAANVAPRRVSAAGLRGYLESGSIRDPDTLLDDVWSLPPGHLLSYRKGKAEKRRYWSVDTVATHPTDFEEAAKALRTRLEDSVQAQLVSDVPLGVFLSGGSDSSVLCAIAAKALGGALHTVTLAFDEPAFDEDPYAARVAAHLGCVRHTVRLSAAECARDITAALDSMDQPSGDGLNTYFVSRAAREAGLTVALSGLGADELFAGYPNFRRFGALCRLAHWADAIPSSWTARFSTATAWRATPGRAAKLTGLVGTHGDPEAVYDVLRGLYGRGQLELLVSRDVHAVLFDGQPAKAATHRGLEDSVNTYAQLELTRYLPNTLLRDTDCMSMAHGLEVRVPYLDTATVELLLAIPGRLKLRSGANKPLLVASARDLPPEIAARPKMGFVLPLQEWMRGPLAPMVDRYVVRGAAGGLLSATGAESIRRGVERGGGALAANRAVSLVALSRWCEQHDVNLALPAPNGVRNTRVSHGARRRILLCLPGAFSGVGGIEMYNRLVVRAFLEHSAESGDGCEILIANDEEDSADPRYLPDGSASIQTFGRRRTRFSSAIVSRVTSRPVDLLVFGHVNFARLAPFLHAIRPGMKTWYLTYGIDVWRRLGAVSRMSLRRAERVVTISDFTRREMARFNGLEAAGIDLLPCAIDPIWEGEFGAYASEARMPARPRLLTVARLATSERRKGIDAVLRALPAVARTIPDVEYTVVGDGDDRPRLEELARSLGIGERVRFAGRVSARELAQAYADCSLFVMPSGKEGFGIVFLEAALFGKASVAGRHGGSTEMVEDGVTGRLVDRENVEGLSAAIGELLADVSALSVLGANARQRLHERFRYPAFRERLHGFLRESDRAVA